MAKIVYAVARPPGVGVFVERHMALDRRDADCLLRLLLPLGSDLGKRLEAFRDGRSSLAAADRRDLREILLEQLHNGGLDSDHELSAKGASVGQVVDQFFTG